MTDLEMLRALLKKTKAGFEELTRDEHIQNYEGVEWTPSKRAATVVRVLPGYRAHFEADFDAKGNILSIGQWESM